MAWQNLAEDLAEEFGAFEQSLDMSPTMLARVAYVSDRVRQYKTEWQRQKRAQQRRLNPPRPVGRPRKSEAEKLAVRLSYASAYNAEAKLERMRAGELGVHLTQVEARSRTARMLGMAVL